MSTVPAQHFDIPDTVCFFPALLARQMQNGGEALQDGSKFTLSSLTPQKSGSL
jgi:hypothetical protein